MREIKFRGYSKIYHRWIYGGIDRFKDVYRIIDNLDVYSNVYPVIEGTIGQYVGKKDLNYKDIYEGDILKVIECEDWGYVGAIGVVEWSEEDDCCFILNFQTGDDLYGLRLTPQVQVEIIGNIYEIRKLMNNKYVDSKK